MKITADIPSLRHLAAVAEIARLESVGRAARAVHLSQPAVTQAVLKLEAALGAPLFERTGTGMFATEAGRKLARRVERALAWLKLAERTLGARPAPLHRLATAVQLQALVAVTEAGGFTEAARRLGVAQPSVHRAVRDLETLSGRALFVRTPHGLEPAREARELARAAGLAFAEIRQGLEEVREQRGMMDGRVRIGGLPLASTYLIPTAVTRLLARFPQARIRIADGAYDEMLHELRHGALDLIVGALRFPAPAGDVRQEPLFVDPLSIMVRAGHPLLRAPPPGPEQLAALDWVAAREGTPARAHFAAFFAGRGMAPPARIVECSAFVAVRGLLLQSDRAALLSAGQVRYETQAGQLAVLQTSLTGTERAIGLTLRADFAPTVMQAAFLDLLRAVVRESEGARAGPAGSKGG